MNPNLISVFNTTKQENNAIDNSLHVTKDENSIDEQKTFYQQTEAYYIKSASAYMFYVYYFIVIGVAFILLFRQNHINVYIRLLIITIFSIYPFIIGYIETYILNILKFFYAFINGNVYYNNGY